MVLSLCWDTAFQGPCFLCEEGQTHAGVADTLHRKQVQRKVLAHMSAHALTLELQVVPEQVHAHSHVCYTPNRPHPPHTTPFVLASNARYFILLFDILLFYFVLASNAPPNPTTHNLVKQTD